MHLILCVDERDGLSFCGRRLSRDSRLIDHILAFTAGHTLWIHPGSAKLFSGKAVMADEQFQKKAGQGDYCFVETTPLELDTEKWESVTLYCWNRAYPATVKFDRNLLQSFHLTHREEFPGSSHENLTMERYSL